MGGNWGNRGNRGLGRKGERRQKAACLVPKKTAHYGAWPPGSCSGQTAGACVTALPSKAVDFAMLFTLSVAGVRITSANTADSEGRDEAGQDGGKQLKTRNYSEKE